MSSDEQESQSSINEGTGDAQKPAVPASSLPTDFIEDDDSLSRKPQDTRVEEGQAPKQQKTTPRESNFASGSSVEVNVRDVPTVVKEYMRTTHSYLKRMSRQLEVLSWIGFAVCCYCSGIKYQADQITDMILMLSLAAMFFNNGIQLPDSLSGAIVKRLTRISE